MASDLVQMHPAGFCDGVLVFEEDQEDKDLECDSWNNSGKCERTQILKNRNNYVLIAQPEGDEGYRAVFQLMTDQAMRNAPEIQFNIHIYEDSRPRGLSVAFTVEQNRKTYYMCVAKSNSQMKVEFKEGVLPKRIDGNTSNLIFNKRSFSQGSSQFFRFETALERDYYLAFERDENGTTRLIVKKAADEVDQTTEIYHAPFP